AYEVTAAGVNPVPVISSTGPAVTWQSYGMSMSPQGDVMVNIHPDLNVYDFDNSTGILTHRWAATLSPFLGVFEFSPDGNLLYGCRSSEIFQMDLNAANVAAFQASQTQISTTGENMKTLQLAPDCKLYAVSSNSPTLHRIDNPNVQGVGCGFTTNAIPLVSGSASFALTNFCSSFFEFPCGNRLDYDLSATNASCVNDGTASVINLTGTAPFVFSWSTGDTTQSISNLSGGMYAVTVSDASGCNITDSVFVDQPQTVVIDNSTITTTSTCSSSDGAIDITTSIGGFGTLDTLLIDGFETDGQITRYTANPYPGNTSTSYFFMRGDDASINFTTNPINEEGTFYFGARRTGFNIIPTICDLTFNPTIVTGYSGLEMCILLALGRNNMSVDANTSITLEYNIDGTGWNTLMDFRQPAANPFAGKNLSEDTDGDGIGDGIALSTTFQDFCYPIPTTGNSIELRITTNASGSSLRQTAFDYVRLKGAPPFTYSYLWSNGDTTQDISNLIAGNYWVQITGSGGCIITDTFTVTSPCTVPVLEASFNLSSTTVCIGNYITFTDASTGNNVFGWNWIFNGGTPASSNTQGSHTITFNTASTYNIVLQATDSSGTDDTTIVITVLPNTIGTTTTSICQGDSTLLGGIYQTVAGTYIDTLASTNGCDSILTTTLTIDPVENATFNYSLPSYCQSEPNQTTTITGTTGGTFSSSPAGLSINGTTGEIDLGLSTPGTYGVLYTTPGASCQDTLTVFVTITTTEDATFNYSSINYCQNDTNPTPNIVGTTGGIFTSSPVGLSINGSSGIIDLNTSTPGNYGVLYTTPSSSCQDTLTFFITIDPSEDATFNYSSTTYCQSDPDPTVNITGTTGGTFTSLPVGLSINSGNGTIDLNTSMPGTYGILYTTSGVSCPDTLTLFITVITAEDATFSYTNTSYCQNNPNPNPIITGTPGGTFTSSPVGLSINGTSGAINLATSTPGTYGVLYVTPNTNCKDTLTVFVTVNANDNAAFNYNTTSFCVTDTNPIATIIGTSGGIFTIDNGGIINTNTGEINILGSGGGTFNVTYATNGTCPDNASVIIIINNVSDASITAVGNYCTGDAAFNLIAANSGGTWSGNGITNTSTGTFNPNSAGSGTHQIIYTISGNCGSADTININTSTNPNITLTIEDDNCFSKNGSLVAVVTGDASPYSYNWDNGENTPVITNLPSGSYTLIVSDSLGCSSSTFGSVADLNNNCDFHIFLPNIFSPNGDGHNDLFIIRGEGIQSVSLVVYSRWGEKVFETNDVEIGWDGTFKDDPMNAAVFVYYLNATMINNETIEQQGNVTLVR
ncbi:MAG: gliding motility-associated C-terminal domain-containing protein, partial [Flavobacteriales bacterium]|nr:gliding motility-associated C-terminal domain-containing protein [Flavobacteriales bacterium]